MFRCSPIFLPCSQFFLSFTTQCQWYLAVLPAYFLFKSSHNSPPWFSAISSTKCKKFIWALHCSTNPVYPWGIILSLLTICPKVDNFRFSFRHILFNTNMHIILLISVAKITFHHWAGTLRDNSLFLPGQNLKFVFHRVVWLYMSGTMRTAAIWIVRYV